MAKRHRANLTLTEYQIKHAKVMAFEMGVDVATVLKVDFGRKLSNLSPEQIEHNQYVWDKVMTEEQRKNPTK